MAQGLPNKFTRDEGAWHFCGRCEDRTPIKNLRSQRGKLLCEKCFDNYPLLGQIDKAIADSLSTIIASPDLHPDKKLTIPTLDGVDDDIYL